MSPDTDTLNLIFFPGFGVCIKGSIDSQRVEGHWYRNPGSFFSKCVQKWARPDWK